MMMLMLVHHVVILNYIVLQLGSHCMEFFKSHVEVELSQYLVDVCIGVKYVVDP